MPVDQIVLGVAAYGQSYSVLHFDAFVDGSTTELAAQGPTLRLLSHPVIHGMIRAVVLTCVVITMDLVVVPSICEVLSTASS